VDYHLSIEEVYTQFAALWVQELPFINVLSARRDTTARRYKSLPSWVADFSHSQGISHNALVRSSDFYRNDQGHNYVFGWKFNAFKSIVDDMSQREIRGQTLVLQRALLTTVNWCHAYDHHESKLMTVLSALQFATNPDIHIGTKDSMYDAVWKTLIVDDPPPTPNQEAFPDTFRAWLLAQMRMLFRECEGRAEKHGLRLQEVESLLTPSTTRRLFTRADVQPPLPQ
jgi:hypothetical protein